MRKIKSIMIVIIAFSLNAQSQIESLTGPRLGIVYIDASPTSGFLNGDIKLEDIGDDYQKYDDITKGAVTTLYGWQWESRFADGETITGVVEWIALVAGMEKGKFLPSLSSMVGARTESGLEFAMGPNVSLSGISMVFGVGYNFKSGNLNIPINFAFVPGRSSSYTETDYIYTPADPGPDGQWGTADDMQESNTEVDVYTVDYNTGNRFSITLGFNLTKD